MPANELLAETVERFARDKVKPRAEELDETEEFPADIYSEMGKLGLFGITVPEADGGVGGTVLDYATVMEELACGYASVADQCGLIELITSLLVSFGTTEQKDHYMAGLQDATIRPAYALTEAESGSDLASIKTRAVADGDSWVLNGEKVYIHNAPVADMAVVLAVTDPEARSSRRLSMFLVDIDATDGAERAYKEHKMGQRASQVGGFVFTDARLGPDAILGELGVGFPAMMNVLDKGRVGIAALSLGIHRAALDAAVSYAKERKQFGQPIGNHQGVAFQLADMATDYQASRQLIHHAANALDTGDPAANLCSMAKLFASEAAVRHTSTAVQVHGGSGYIRGVEVERLYRDARITMIYEGTSEIQRMIISRALLRTDRNIVRRPDSRPSWNSI